MPSSVDTGPLDWRIAITDQSGRPTPEFQRRWNTQRNNNALIGTIQFGTGVPTGTPADGAEYVDTTRVPGILYIGKGGHWILAGVQSFTNLKDVPQNYTSAAGKIVRVNPGGTALIFDTLTSVLDALGSAQGDILYRGSAGWTVLAPGTAGKVLSTNGPGADPTWITAGGGGGGTEPREGSVTKPLVASFATVNFVGSTTAVDGVTGIILSDPVLASQFRLLEQTAAVPATPWSLYGRFDYQPQAASQGGLTLRNSTTGRLVFWGRYQGGMLQTYWNSVTSFNSNPFGPVNVSGVPVPKWWRIDNDGTNLKFWYSPDGRDWFTEANLNPTLAAFIGTVDRVGFGIELDNSSATDHTWVRCSSFSFTAPT